MTSHASSGRSFHYSVLAYLHFQLWEPETMMGVVLKPNICFLNWRTQTYTIHLNWGMHIVFLWENSVNTFLILGSNLYYLCSPCLPLLLPCHVFLHPLTSRLSRSINIITWCDHIHNTTPIFYLLTCALSIRCIFPVLPLDPVWNCIHLNHVISQSLRWDFISVFWPYFFLLFFPMYFLHATNSSYFHLCTQFRMWQFYVLEENWSLTKENKTVGAHSLPQEAPGSLH